MTQPTVYDFEMLAERVDYVSPARFGRGATKLRLRSLVPLPSLAPITATVDLEVPGARLYGLFQDAGAITMCITIQTPDTAARREHMIKAINEADGETLRKMALFLGVKP